MYVFPSAYGSQFPKGVKCLRLLNLSETEKPENKCLPNRSLASLRNFSYHHVLFSTSVGKVECRRHFSSFFACLFKCCTVSSFCKICSINTFHFATCQCFSARYLWHCVQTYFLKTPVCFFLFFSL